MFVDVVLWSCGAVVEPKKGTTKNKNSPVAGSKKARTYLKMMRVIILFGSLSMSARYLQSYQASQARPGDGNE